MCEYTTDDDDNDHDIDSRDSPRQRATRLQSGAERLRSSGSSHHGRVKVVPFLFFKFFSSCATVTISPLLSDSISLFAKPYR